MKFEAIIFDFDGVLFDSEKIHLHACNQVFKDLGFTIPEDEYFQAYVGLSDNEIFDLILKNKNIQLSSDQVIALRKRKIIAYKDYVTSHVSLDGVSGVKEFLKIHARIIDHFAICSGATREEIEATLIKLEQGKLRAHFKHIVSIDDIRLGKPSPEGYLLAANRLNVLPQYCLAIEDTPIGIAAAKSAGMTVIGITTTHEKAVLKNADFVANSYHEINSWIKSCC